MKFKSITSIDDSIHSQEEFDICFYSGSDKLLEAKSYEDCLFCSINDDDDVSELFYFLEGNSETLLHQDNMTLNRLDDIKFVLIDNNEEQGIVILKINQDTVENFI